MSQLLHGVAKVLSYIVVIKQEGLIWSGSNSLRGLHKQIKPEPVNVSQLQNQNAKADQLQTTN